MDKVRTGLALAWLYIRNLCLLLNHVICWLIGKDPRMTLSAVAWLHQVRWLMAIANALYRDPEHCRKAATGWDTAYWRQHDRSLWRHP